MRSRALIVLVVGVALGSSCAGSLPLCTRPVPGPEGGWPLTPGGRTAAAYLETFNRGDVDALLSFSRKHRSPSVPPPNEAELAEGYRQMAGTLGCMVPQRVEATDEGLT